MWFFTTSAHHSPSGELGGIRWIRENKKEMLSARRWFVGGSDELKRIVDKAFKQYGIALYSRPEPRPGGELGGMASAAPSFHIIDHTVYHTTLDTLDAVPAYGLEQSARAFAKVIDEVNKLSLGQLRVHIPTN